MKKRFYVVEPQEVEPAKPNRLPQAQHQQMHWADDDGLSNIARGWSSWDTVAQD